MNGRPSGETEGSVLLSRDSLRTNRVGRPTPLVRSEISDTAEEEFLEIPVPVALGGDADPVRVLHVDDDPEIGEITATFLERIDDDFAVTTETTVVGALNRLQESEFDCVVSDYDMPNTNGIEFLEIVRERDPDLPFILFTGKGSEAVASEAIAADVTDYMQKGGGSDQYEVLANRVKNAVDRYRTQQQFWNALSWYQRLVEQELAGVFILQDGEFVYVNEKFGRLFGRRQSELVGTSPIDLAATDEDGHELRRALFDHRIDEGDTFRCRITAERADGTPFDAEVHGGAIEYEGRPARIGILRHVSA